jgi:hypothetical protein
MLGKMKAEDKPIFDKLDDTEAAVITIFGEARGESFLGKQMVAQVIANRAFHWDMKVKDVCFQKNQFSCFISSDPNYVKLLEIAKDFEESLEKSQILTWCLKAWKVNRIEVAKSLKGSTFYRVIGYHEPWFQGQIDTKRLVKTVQEGHHEFFREARFES